MIAIFILFILCMSCECFYWYYKYKNLNKKRVEDSLDIVTTTQILAELRNRPNFPFILILPSSNEFSEGSEIIVSKIPPDDAINSLNNAERFLEDFYCGSE